MSKYVVQINELKIKEKFIKKANYVSMPKSIVYCETKKEALNLPSEEEARALANYLKGLTGITHEVERIEA